MDVNMNSIMGYPTDTIYSNGFNINPIILIIIVIVLILYYVQGLNTPVKTQCSL